MAEITFSDLDCIVSITREKLKSQQTHNCFSITKGKIIFNIWSNIFCLKDVVKTNLKMILQDKFYMGLVGLTHY